MEKFERLGLLRANAPTTKDKPEQHVYREPLRSHICQLGLKPRSVLLLVLHKAQLLRTTDGDLLFTFSLKYQ